MNGSTSTSTPGQGGAHPIRVLVVDDHAVVRRGLTDLLSGAAGIEVVC